MVLVAFFAITDLTNASKCEEWVNSLLKKAIAGHADGVNIDIEGPIKKGSKEVVLLNELTANVYKTFKEKLPGSQVLQASLLFGPYLYVADEVTIASGCIPCPKLLRSPV